MFRRLVRERDKVCQMCGTAGTKANPLTVHHKIPRAYGGSNSADNCILLCQNCHRRLHQQEGYPTRVKSKKNRKHRR